MAVLLRDRAATFTSVMKNPVVRARDRDRRKQIVSLVILVIFAFQVIDLLGSLFSHSMTDLWTALLGLALCGMAILFNRLGNVAVVSILLIIVVDLGCGMMLLASPMGLDVDSLPVFDVLLISELIAVSLLPALWVFPVTLANILFTISVILLVPHTPAMAMMLMSDMAFNMVSQPITLQVVVAIVSFIWVQSALNAIARADRAEEISELQRREAELQRREIEQKQELDQGVEYLSQVLVNAANGQNTIRASLNQDNALWRIGNALNLLLTRWRRASQAEQENQRLRAEIFRISEALHKARFAAEQSARSVPKQKNPFSQM